MFVIGRAEDSLSLSLGRMRGDLRGDGGDGRLSLGRMEGGELRGDGGDGGDSLWVG